MAVSFYNVHDQNFAIVDQAGWGTSVATNAAGKGIHCPGFDIPAQFRLIEPVRARAQRYNHPNDLEASVSGLMTEFTLPAHPFLKDQGDYWLYAVMQNVTEGAATPYQKANTFGQFQPDFTADAGLFFSLVGKQPVATTSQRLEDCICSQVVLRCSPTADDGLLMVEPTVIGRVQTDVFNYTGTVTYPDAVEGTDFFDFWNLTSEFLTTGIILGDDGFTITISNNAKPVGNDTAGKFTTYGLQKYTVVTEIQALWDATVRTQMVKGVAGTESQNIDLYWGTTGTDAYLNFTSRGKFRDSRELSKIPEGEFVTLRMESAGTWGGNEPFQADIANALDRTW